MSNDLATAHEHLQPAWPVVLWVGVLLLIAFGVLAVFGGIAGIVGNSALAKLIVIRIVPAPFLIGFLLFMLGGFGWWTLLAIAVLVAFGFAVRPRKRNNGGTE